MKTNVTLVSKDREIFGLIVKQNTKDGFFCITDAMKALEHKRKSKGLSNKRLNDIINTKSFQENLNSLLSELYLDYDNSRTPSNNMSINELRKMKLAYRQGRIEQNWFINPYVFTMIIMEMDPDFYAKVIIWLTDGLINFRNEAGDLYIRLSKAVFSIIEDKEFQKTAIKDVANAMKCVIFNSNESNLRQKASEIELKELNTLQNNISMLIEDRFIKTYGELIKYLRVKWAEKWAKKIIINNQNKDI